MIHTSLILVNKVFGYKSYNDFIPTFHVLEGLTHSLFKSKVLPEAPVIEMASSLTLILSVGTH